MLDKLENNFSWANTLAYFRNVSDKEKIYCKLYNFYGFDKLPMRLCQPPDGSTSPKYKLLHF